MSEVHESPVEHTVTPYLVVRGVPTLIDFLTRVFGAEEQQRMPRPDGTVVHAEVRIGDSIVMMGEPASDGELMPASIYLRLGDVDAAYARAVAAGGISLREPQDQSHGVRMAGVKDASGNVWWINSPL